MTPSPTRESPGPEIRPPRSRAADLVAKGLVTLIGLVFGSSIFLGFGYYEIAWWGTLALVFLVLALALSIAWPTRPSGPSLAVVGGLGALWAWSAASTRWAESADQAMVDADRWLLYAAVLIVLLALLRGRKLERLLLAAAVAPVIAVAAYLLVRMLAGSGSDLFLGNRLNEPLDYINGLAGFLLIALWPLVAVAERARNPVGAGAALAGAVALVGLVAMTQSRGSIAAFAVTAAILLALVPGRVQRGWLLVALVAGVAACAGPLADVFEPLGPGALPADDTIAGAARRIALAAVLLGAGWAAVTAGGWLRPGDSGEGPVSRAPGIALAAVASIGLVVTGTPISDRADRLSEQYEAFTELRDAGDGSRLATGGGNRYDYWRIAVGQFEDAPIKGIGAGNYDTTYFRERDTAENIRNPHSMQLQVLGETGLVGGIALLFLLGGAGWGLWRRSAPGSPDADPLLAVAAGGAFLAWAVQTSVDWLHLIPGLTGVALCAVAVLVAPSAREWRFATPRAAGVATGAAVLAAILAAVLVAGPLVADRLVASGRDRLEDDPEGAVERVDDALAADDESTAAYQLKAAALARQGDYEGARAALVEATRREPSDYVNWALLGDLATRRGDAAAARRAYAKALELNPLEPGLKAPGATGGRG